MPLSDVRFVVFDVESTGLDATKDEVVEVAAVATSLSNPLIGMWSTLVRPSVSIPPEVSCVHGLTDDDVAAAPLWADALPRLHAFLAPMAPIVKVSHNFAFDSAFLHTRNGVCTERLARHLWKDAPNYKNGTLRYWRKLQVDTFGIAPHRALGDALVTAALLRDLLTSPAFAALAIDDTAALIAFCDAPIIHETWPFGKYKGEPIDARDRGYITWCLTKKDDLSPDMRATLLHVLERERLCA